MNESGSGSDINKMSTMNSMKVADSMLGQGATMMGEAQAFERPVDTWPWYLMDETNKYLMFYKLFIKALVIPVVGFNLFFITFGFGDHSMEWKREEGNPYLLMW